MGAVLIPEVPTASALDALERLRRRYARQVRYPWLTEGELRRLDFLRYCFALRGWPAEPEVSAEVQELGRKIEFYLTGYGRGRVR